MPPKPRICTSALKEMPKFEVVNPKFSNEKMKALAPQYKYATELMNGINQEQVYQNIMEQPVTLKLSELLGSSYDLGRRLQSMMCSQHFPLQQVNAANAEVVPKKADEEQDLISFKEDENPTETSEAMDLFELSETFKFAVDSGEARSSHASTEELHELSYQNMMQEDYIHQFIHPIKEVNLAHPHEYCTMVTTQLNGHIGEQDYMMLVNSGSELNIMTMHQAQELALLIDDSGNSWTLKGISSHMMGLEGICWNVPIKIGGIEFSHNFFMTRSSLGNKDMVLGQPWLFSQSMRINYVHEMGVTLQLWENGDQKGRSILINLPLIKAPRNVMPIRFRHGYELYSVESTEIPEFKLASPGTDPSSAKVPIFMSRAINALQIGEYKSEKQWPDGMNEDLILESSLCNPFISQIMKHTWFASANNAAEMTLLK